MHSRLVLALGFVGVGLGAPILLATPPTATPASQPSAGVAESPVQSEQEQGNVFGGVARSNTLLGDFFGARTALARRGISLNLSETSEVFGNLSGGTRKGADYDGLTQMALQLDTARAFDWHGGLFNVSALQIHGRNLSADDLDDLQTASGIEADRATRLWELWYQQKFLEDDSIDVKVGQQSLDQEFIVSQNSGYFVNTMMGWPLVPSVDLPGGGPAYPLSALGVRLRAHPTDAVTVLAGAFNGSPVLHNGGDPQQENRTGAQFPLNGSVLAIAEVQYTYPSLGTIVYADESSEPLSGTYRLGFFYDSETFSDLRFDSRGIALASPASNGIPRPHSGDWAFYGVIDQMIWRSAEDDGKNLNFFARALGTPQSDRNLVNFSVNSGLILHDPLPSRPDDIAGIGMGYGHISDDASAADRDTAFFTGTPYPIRTGETFLELTYQYQVTPWCVVQPDFQYVFNPGGGILDPDSPGQRLKNETVVGVRVNLQF